jgi:hypothetical protein
MSSFIFSLPQLIIVLLAIFTPARLSWGMKFIAIQAFISFCTDLAAVYMAKMLGMNNEFVYMIYMIAEFVLITEALRRSMINAPRINTSLQIVTFAFPILAILTMAITNFEKFNYTLLSISFVILSVINLAYLILPDIRKQPDDGLLLVSIGHVIYFLGVTPYFVVREIMMTSRPDLDEELFDYINIVLAMCRYGFIIAAFVLIYIAYFKRKINP